MTISPVPVNSLTRHIQPFQDLLAATATDVIRSGYYVLGPGVAGFEAAFAAYCDVSHCIGVANGTDAIELALKGASVGQGDLVALAANAAMYGTSAVLACGAKPIYIDVAPGQFTIDPEALRRVLVATPNIKSVIVTHLYGRVAAMDEILAVCRKSGASVVEDCAQAHGARLADGRVAGSLGDVASFSFYPTKNLGALGDGGAVVTNNAAIGERVRKLRQYGWGSKYLNTLTGGRNSRLDEIQASMLSIMLPMLDTWNDRRRAIANRYSREIVHPRILVPLVSGSEYVAHLYVIRSQHRDSLRRHLEASGIQTDVHYPLPDHRQPCHQGKYDDVILPVTEGDALSVLTLPCFPELRDDEVRRVIDACNNF